MTIKKVNQMSDGGYFKTDTIDQHQSVYVRCRTCTFAVDSGDYGVAIRHANNNSGHTVLYSAMRSEMINVIWIPTPSATGSDSIPVSG